MTSLIIALDFNHQSQALSFIDELDPNTCILKVGSELFTLLGPHFVSTLIQKQFKVFLDLKFHDIPTTVARACHVACDLGVWMLNVHASGGMAMMQAARDVVLSYGNNRPLLIAVTVLTSMTPETFASFEIPYSLADYVKKLAILAQACGLDGVVSSALEVPLIKEACGKAFLTVTPGIRLQGGDLHDQHRVITPRKAREAGSDYIVVGRAITTALKPNQVIHEILLQLS